MPDTKAARDELFYADILTSAETFIGEPQASMQEAWVQTGYPDNMSAERARWVLLLPFGRQLRPMMDDGGQSTGLDVTTIERGLVFGRFPENA